MKNRRKLSSTHFVTYTAIFSALAGVLMVLEIPLFFAPVFYKIDLSEIPVLICTFYLGPVAGVTCELIKVLVKLMARQGVSEEAAKKKIREVDKDRSSYYRYYTDQVWGDVNNYDLCVNSSRIGVSGTVDVIKAYIDRRCAEEKK